MSGGTKQQFKQFSITCAEDACLVLGMLISGMTVNLEKYKEYASEAESLLESTQEEYVPAKEYDDVNDKLLYRQREILKFTADHQSSSFSYIDLRKILEKHKYVSSPLSEEVSAILSEFLDVRNWTFHNPQSLMVAAKEVAHKDIPDELKEIAQVTPQLNPVLIRKICRYELVMFGGIENNSYDLPKVNTIGSGKGIAAISTVKGIDIPSIVDKPSTSSIIDFEQDDDSIKSISKRKPLTIKL